MGTDRDERSCNCLCGQGKIRVLEESPDHMYARAHQTTYTGYLECEACAVNYVIADDFLGRPYLAPRAEIEAKDTAKAEYWTLDKKFREHDLAKSLAPSLIHEINEANAKSKAEAHRTLIKHGLTTESLASYRKHPSTAETYVVRASGYALAKIGETLGKTEQDRTAFAKVRQQLDKLSELQRKHVAPIPSGHPWLKA